MATNESLSKLWNEVLRRMELVNPNSSSIPQQKWMYGKLEQYIRTQCVPMYSQCIGEAFLEEMNSQEVPLTSKAIARTLIKRLDSCLSENFWAEDYYLDKYTVKNSQLKSCLDKILSELETWGMSQTIKDYTVLCIYRLDLYMYEYHIDSYTPDIGIRFLKCMEQVSSYTSLMFDSLYRRNIRRLDAYFRGEVFFQRVPRGYSIKCQELQENMDRLIDLLIENQFKDSSINIARQCFSQLDFFMSSKGYVHYEPDIGAAFISHYKSMPDQNSQIWLKRMAAVIAKHDDLVSGRKFQVKHCAKKGLSVPDEFSEIFEMFITECRNLGNAEKTIIKKTYGCSIFLQEALKAQVSDVSGFTSEKVVEICLGLYPQHWYSTRCFLQFCASQDFTNRNYSYLVPKQKHINLIPPYYSKEERQLLEKAPDRDTPIGKRDYAIILLANRLGLRNSDIAGLKFSELHHGKKTINIEQFKTGEPLSLPLLEEIEKAVDDYTEYSRAESDSDKVFLRAIAPYIPICASGIYSIITRNFMLAGVDISNRKHGAHALRASLTSDLINNGFSYEETRSVIGHKTKNVISHYGSLDVEHLRLCALEPIEPKGAFRDILATHLKVRT